MKDKGVLRIVGLESEGGVELRFIDTGPGISPEVRERLF